MSFFSQPNEKRRKVQLTNTDPVRCRRTDTDFVRLRRFANHCTSAKEDFKMSNEAYFKEFKEAVLDNTDWASPKTEAEMRSIKNSLRVLIFTKQSNPQVVSQIYEIVVPGRERINIGVESETGVEQDMLKVACSENRLDIVKALASVGYDYPNLTEARLVALELTGAAVDAIKEGRAEFFTKNKPEDKNFDELLRGEWGQEIGLYQDLLYIVGEYHIPELDPGRP